MFLFCTLMTISKKISMFSSDSERKHLLGMGESPNTSNYRKSTGRETEGVMFLMHSKLPLTHDRSHYHIGTNLLICRANQWTGFYMIGPPS